MAGNVKLMTSAGGGVVLDTATTTATDVTVKVPVTGVNNGTLVCSDSSGNVGIGTSSLVIAPAGQTTLEIKGSSDRGNLYLNTAAADGLITCGVIGFLGGDSTSSATEKRTSLIAGYTEGATANARGGYLTFSTKPNGASSLMTERMRIDSSGNLVVGTASAGARFTCYTSAAQFAGKFENNNATWEIIEVKNSSGSTVGAQIQYNKSGAALWQAGASSDATPSFTFRTNGSQKAYIDWTTGSFNAVSDSRLKTDVKSIAYGLETILSLNPVSYKLIEDESNKNQVGLIAQEVLSVVPEIVGVPEDIETGRYALNYSGIVPILIKAIQEQQAQIETLTAKVAALEAK